MREVSLPELVLDQAICCCSIRYTQQSFRQDHQRQSLLGGERILAQQLLYPAKPATARPDRFDHATRKSVHLGGMGLTVLPERTRQGGIV
jgi:hypothetical protein